MREISNGLLTLTVSEIGAEPQGLYCNKALKNNLLWEGGSAWDRRAPVCLPWCGRLKDGVFLEGDVLYRGDIHGFWKDRLHQVTEQRRDRVTLSAHWGGQDLSRWPWPFLSEITHALEGNRLVTTVSVTGAGTRPMPLQIGFHTGLRCPFGAGEAEDYQLRFSEEERPVELLCSSGFLTGESRPLFTGRRVVPLRRDLFDRDSILLTGLRSDWIRLEERNSGGYLEVEIRDFPCVLLWSAPGIPGFLCIEPWHGMPGRAEGGYSLWERPYTRSLEPGETFTARQTITVALSV